MTYQHKLNGEISSLPVGKVVCIGRNYADHARELNNPIPTEPLLFMKPNTALVAMAPSFSIPADRGSCHIETEMALLIGERLTQAQPSEALSAIAGVGIGFDLTLRDLQTQLKDKGQPWEKAKGFDGSCPLSGFVSPGDINWADVQLRLSRNGELQQNGNSANMLNPVAQLLAAITEHFTLLPGDVVLTGTPAGVGPLSAGDTLSAQLGEMLSVESRVSDQ